MELWKIGLGLFVLQMIVMHLCIAIPRSKQPVVLTARQRFAKKRALLVLVVLIIIPALVCALWDYMKDEPKRQRLPSIQRFLKLTGAWFIYPALGLMGCNEKLAECHQALLAIFLETRLDRLNADL